MKRYIRLCILLIFLFGNLIRAKGQELTIGDTLPDFLFTHVLRYPAASLKLSDFRGKILILDLWRTTCGHAVASFAHFDSLEQQFKGKVSALAITTEDQKDIVHYLEENHFAEQTTLPVITNDSLLAGKRFTFIYIPHVVVADAKGRIVAIANAEKITPAVIQNLIDKKQITLPLKKEIVDFNYDVPILLEGNGRNLQSLALMSTFTRRLPGVLSLQSVDTLNNQLLYLAYNVSIPELYAQAFHLIYEKNKTILDVNDSSRFVSHNYDDEDWQRDNLWCYNLLLPKTGSHPEKIALDDFDRFFGTRGAVEQRKMKCLLLVRTGKGERWKAVHTEDDGYYLDSGSIKVIHNVVLPFVSNAWNYLSTLPILNETGLENARVDMRMTGNPNGLSAFRKQLQRYDLDLVPAVREMKVLVITETNGKDTKYKWKDKQGLIRNSDR